MSTYLKLFENHTQYETFIGGGGDTQFIKPNVSYCTEENEVHYNPLPHDYSKDYLTFVALEDGTFTFTPKGGNVISYSLDEGNTWTELAAYTNTPTVTRGKKVLWRGEMTRVVYGGVGTFSSTSRFEVQGNIMSLLFGADFQGKTGLTGKSYAFFGLFDSNSKLVNAQNLSLPATTLATYCYQQMFYGCTGLTSAPVLPAITLAEGCYYEMFYDCTNLVNATELPATTLADWCYSFMFRGCTSLTTAPELPATILANNCYRNMFNGCSSLNYIKCLATNISASSCLSNWVDGVASTGTFVKNANMESWTTGKSGIPKDWTVVPE